MGRGVGMASDRPSVFLNQEELAHLRTELKTVEWKREIYEKDVGTPRFIGSGIKPNADRWLKQDIVVPARSGHYHNFFCDDGTELRVPDDGKPHAEGYTCPACGKVYKGEKYDAAVRWLIHNRLAVAAFDLGLTYAIEGDERYAEKAAEILIKYADAYPGPHTGHTQGGIMYQSLCESVWVIPLAGAYDLIYDSGALSDADNAHIEDKLFRPVAQGLIDVPTGGNWKSWHLSAVGVVGYAIHDQKLIQYAIDAFEHQITHDLGDDGIWPESIHTYHFFALQAFLYLAEAARHNGVDLYHFEPKPGKSLKSMFTAPIAYAYPDFRLPAINDGWFDIFLPLNLYELAYARYDSNDLGWMLKEGYEARSVPRSGVWALLQGVSLDKEFHTPTLPSTNYPGVGIAVLRSPNSNMMTFDYGPFMGHGQPDKLGITLFANGSLMAADYGTPGYGSASMQWYVHTPAHNTVIVDGKDQAHTNERRLTHFRTGKVFEVAEAETEQAYPRVLHKRTVMRVGKSFIVIDRLTSKDKHTYDWFFRSEGKLDLVGETVSKPLGYQFVDEKSQLSTDAPWKARWDLDRKGLNVFMLDSHPSLITVAECPAETTARKIPLLIVRKEGKDEFFVAVLAPFQGDSKVECSESDGLIRLEHDGMIDWVFVKASGRSKALQTDGDFALVRTESDKPILASVIGGKSVTWKGRVQKLE
jgi:hypothetical protein